jgi:chitodextrinase/flagellar hook assembly protein FlgD
MEYTNYDMTVRAVDNVGNVAAASAALAVRTSDVTAPSVVTGLNATNVTATGFTLSWSTSSDGTGSGVKEYQVLRNGIVVATVTAPTLTVAQSGLAEYTNYNMTVRAVDNAGNVAAASAVFAVRTTDVTAPSAVSGLVAENMTHAQFDLSWSPSTDGVGSGIESYQVYVNGTLVQTVSAATKQLVVSGLSEFTTYTVAVKAKDLSGNVSADGQTLSVKTTDITAPTVPDGLQATNITSSSFDLTWAISADNDRASGYEVYVDNVLAVKVEEPSTPLNKVRVDGLQDITTYSVTVKAFDPSGNLSTAGRALTVITTDGTAPTIPTMLQASSIKPNSFTLSWAASSDNVAVLGYNVYKNGVLVETVTGTEANLAGLTYLSTYLMSVTAIDGDGNESVASGIFPVMTDDLDAPSAPTSLTSSELTATSFKLTWTAASDAETSIAGYKVFQNGNYLGTTTETHYQLSGLTQLTDYVMTVSAFDIADNVSAISLPLLVLTKDGTAPSSPTRLVYSNLHVTGFKLNWLPSLDNVSVKGYSVYLDGSLSKTVDATTLNLSFTNLTPQTVYNLFVESFDDAGNVSPASLNLLVKTPADVTAPTKPGGLQVVTKTQNSIRLSWEASTDDVGVVNYRVETVAPGTTPVYAVHGYGPTTTYEVTDLLMDTEYSFVVSATDLADNVSQRSAVLTVKTLPDMTPPTSPTELAVTMIQDNGATFSWNAATDNVAVVKYEIYDGEKMIHSTGNTIATLTNLQASTTYRLQLVALDAKNNKSTPVTFAEFETLADTVRPTTPGQPEAQEISSTFIILKWTPATDNVNIASYQVFMNGERLGETVEATYTADTLSVRTTYTFHVIAVDGSNNISDASLSSTFTTTADKTPPTAPTDIEVSDVQRKSVVLSWKPSTDNVAVTNYEIYINGKFLALTSNITYKIENLLLDTEYKFSIRAVDVEKNRSPYSTLLVTRTQPDPVPPTQPTNLSYADLETISVLVRWSPAIDDEWLAGYQIYVGDTLVGTSKINVFAIKNLLPETEYRISVKAIDSSGNLSESSENLLITTPPDVSPPFTPEELRASEITATSLKLQWKPSVDDVAVVRYEVYMNDTLVHTTETNGIAITALSASTSYKFNVLAVDAAGKKSTLSSPLQVTTLAEQATAGPVITIKSITNGWTSTVSTISYELNVRSKVTATLVNRLNRILLTPMQNVWVKPGVSKVTYSFSTVASGTYTAILTATNEAGGTTAAYQTIVVDKTPPAISSLIVSNSVTDDEAQKIAKISYKLSEVSRVSVGIFDATDRLVRQITKLATENAGDNSVTWDGKTATGIPVRDGLYTIKVDAVDRMNLAATQRVKNIRVEVARPQISSVTAMPNPFRVTGANLMTINYRLSEDARVEIKIVDKDSVVVRTFAFSPKLTGANSQTWNARNAKNIVVPDGEYTYQITARDIAGKLSEVFSGSIRTDRTAPLISDVVVTPESGNMVVGGQLGVQFKSSESVKVDVAIIDSANKEIAVLARALSVGSDIQSLTWDGKGSTGETAAAGAYKVKMNAVDDAGWRAKEVLVTFSIVTPE